MDSEKQDLKNALTSLQTILENEQYEKEWRPTWNDIKDFEAPDRGRYLTNSVGSATSDGEFNDGGNNRRKYMIDDTPEKAANVLAAGFQSFLTPKGKLWHKYNPDDPRAVDDYDIREWLDNIAEYVRNLMTARGTNFYTALYNVYLESILFGTGAMLIEEDDETMFRARHFTAGEYAFACDYKGNPDTFVRHDWWTCKQLVGEFGLDNVSEATQKCYNNRDYNKPILIFHAICPNELLPVDSKKPFTEAYWESGSDDTLMIDGYYEFPVMIPRWNVIGNDVYGTECPGMKALGSAQMLQVVYEDWAVAFRKEVRPPMVADASIDMMNLEPDGISTSTSTSGNQHALRPAVQISANLNAATEALREMRENIKDTFFNRLFNAISDLTGDRRTTAEIMQRKEETFVQLGPVLNSFDEDLLSPAHERILAILDRNGTFREGGLFPMPASASDVGIEIEYTSLLAQAAKAVGNNNLDLFLQRVMGVMQLDPNAFAKVNAFELINHYADTQSVPGRIMNSDEEAQEILAAIAEKQQQQQQAEQAAMMAQSANQLSQAKVGDKNGLEAFIDASAEG